jgi:glycine/D-amino acid oxidase-like deaminating enzyme
LTRILSRTTVLGNLRGIFLEEGWRVGLRWYAAALLVPALAGLHAIRIWAGMNVNIDRAPILGEVPGLPGFYNCVSSNGYTLAPVLARRCCCPV